MPTLSLNATRSFRRLRLILGDQLNASHSWFQTHDDDTLYLIAELHQETNYVAHHIQKVCAFFAAMQNFAHAMSDTGHCVLHLTLDDTQAFDHLDGLLRYCCDQFNIDTLEYMLPDEYRLREQLKQFHCAQLAHVEVCESEHFYLSEQEVTKQFKTGHRHQLEAFYRRMRKRFNILMEGDTPLGGAWNFDKDNRHKLGKNDFADIPQPLVFGNDVSDIKARLKRHNITTIGYCDDTLLWPVTRVQARELLRFFCQHCLPRFGRFQDAMTKQTAPDNTTPLWSLFHSRVSFALNAKIISPQEVVNTTITAFHNSDGAVSIAQIEGFVRQVIGWREFVRGIYWANMPEYANSNQLSAKRSLPSWFWDGNTKMACQAHAITQSLDYAYAHHIQRLMITGNFCLIAGIHPDEVDAWYLGIYIDAIEWVEMPNTRGMSQFADGGIVGSKAYAASGNYVKNMSDYCKNCHYTVSEITSDRACPLNALYWQFIHRHEDSQSANPRNKMIYANWRKKSPEQQQAILDKADDLLANLNEL